MKTNTNLNKTEHHARTRGIGAKSKVFRPLSAQGKYTKGWYTRLSILGTRPVFSLGVDRTRAEKLDRELRRQIRSENFKDIASIKAWLSKKASNFILSPLEPCNPGVRRGPATIRDLLHVYRSSYLEAKPATTYRYSISLLNLVETALRYRKGQLPLKRSGRRHALEQYGKLLTTPLTVLTDRIVADFKASRMAEISRGTPEEKSRKISTNTEIRQARCVFSKEAQQAYRDARLKLPDLTSFLGAPRFQRVVCRPQLPDDSLLRNVFGELSQLKNNDDNELYIIISLALLAGLRRNEILHSCTSWLQTTNGPSMVIRLAEDFSTKNHTERTVPLVPDLYATLKNVPGPYLLRGAVLERNRTLDRAVAWLRGRGFNVVRKPLHMLRAFYAAYLLATENSPFRIKSRLGHADLTTTFRHYADEPLGPHLVDLWQRAGLGQEMDACGQGWMGLEQVKHPLSLDGKVSGRCA